MHVPLRRTKRWLVWAGLLVSLSFAGQAVAKDKAIFSPIIDVDAERGFIFVSADSGIVIVKASDAAMPHLGKLPIMGMIDLVVEMKPGDKVVYLKSWKVVAGDSECMIFDGKTCK